MSKLATIDPDTARELLDRAREARRHSYSPYSDFSVGAALLAADGRIFTGVNVENASYPLGMCAERVAVGTAVAEGAHDFLAVAVVGPEDDVACSPCGGCRQVLYEFSPDMVVVMPEGADVRTSTVRDLLPGAFDAGRLTRRKARG